MSKHFAKQKKTLQESILLFLCLCRLIRRLGIKYKILILYQNKILCNLPCKMFNFIVSFQIFNVNFTTVFKQ